MVYQNIARTYKQDDLPNSKHLQSEILTLCSSLHHAKSHNYYFWYG